MTDRRAVASPDAPTAIGPYSPAIRSGNLLFLSGQIPLSTITGTISGSDVAAQTEQVMRNLSALLTAAGATFAEVVRTTVFLIDLEEFGTMNAVYATYMTDPPPARTTVQVARLPLDALVEIDLIAVLPNP